MLEMLKKITRELGDYLELFVIPALSVLMPWPLAMRFFRLVARVPFLYTESTRNALAGGHYLGLVDDEARWIRQCKIGQIVDFADVFWLMTRGEGYLNRYVDENLSQQLSEQQIIFVPHYGAGMWIYPLLVNHGVPLTLLVNSPTKAWRARQLYGRLRFYWLKRLGVRIITAKDMLAVRDALRKKRSILVLPDLPQAADLKAYQLPTELGELNVASSFFELAENRKIPIINAILDLDIATGRRVFTAERWENQSASDMATAFAEKTVTAIKRRPYLWWMLVVAPQIMLKTAK